MDFQFTTEHRKVQEVCRRLAVDFIIAYHNLS